MSTKCTLSYRTAEDDTDFHLYNEMCEGDGVYLRLNKPKDFEVSPNEITVRIPFKVAKMIFNERIVEAMTRHKDACNNEPDVEVQIRNLERLVGKKK